jgi:ribosomal protein S12 methylthiotransferase
MTYYHLVSLGCAKNTVDSQSISALLQQQSNFVSTQDPSQANVILINTCGFIGAARQETIEVLGEFAAGKQPGQLLVAAGCMAQLFEEQIRSTVPSVDLVIGSQNWLSIPKQIAEALSPAGFKAKYGLPSVPRIAVQGPSAYLEISNGCRRQCSYCSIPNIKGSLRSRSKDSILSDAMLLQENLVKEIMIIGQDTSDYGHDQKNGYGLVNLLDDLFKTVPNVPWIRLLYAFPGIITDDFINMMKNNEQFLNYLDIPLQHAHPTILRSMNRPANIDHTKENLLRLRQEIPGIALRTTFIVGYPGEGEEEFQTLLNFIEEIQFDRVGVFPFSFEANTPSAPLGDPIPESVKSERVDQLMRLQQEISWKLNQTFIGKTVVVLIEGNDLKEKISVGRTYRDAPEIDGLVFVNGVFNVGDLIAVKITEALEYDLIGEAD